MMAIFQVDLIYAMLLARIVFHVVYILLIYLFALICHIQQQSFELPPGSPLQLAFIYFAQ
jgi:hypothetical protein